MPDFRRGAEAFTEAQERAKSSGGNFKPFTPSIFWQEGNERYVLILNSMADIPLVDKFINFVPAGELKGGRKLFEQVIARTDPVVGEDTDPMVEDWGADPKEQGIAFAVELEPTFEEVKGRKRPTGFQVATTEYDRRVRDDKGELTDETEEVVSPVVGFITQSPHNFFNLLTSYDANEAPIEETPIKITRVDSKTYQVNGYPDQAVDLGDLIEYIDGVSWLGEDLDDLLDQIAETESDEEAAAVIGAFFLDKRLAELVDEDRYKELYENIEQPFKKFGSDKKKSGGKKERTPRERPARRSQRRTESPESETDAPEPEAEPESKPEPKARKPRQRAAKPKDEPKAEADDAPAEEPKARKPSSRQSAGKSKLDELRARAAAKKDQAAA